MNITIGSKRPICNTNTLFQYLLIYLLIVMHGAKIYALNELLFTYVSVFIGLSYILFHRNMMYSKYISHMVIVTLFMMLLMLIHGQPYFVTVTLRILEPLILLYVAFNIDKKHFFARVISAVCFFAGISLLFYIIQIKNSNLLIKYLKQVPGWQLSNFYGVLLYTYRGTYAGFRNNGIFTEPGLYQMILNAALSVLLFFPKCFVLSKKRYILSVILLVITIITTGSTTGYLSLAIIMAGLLIRKNNGIENRGMRRYAVGIMFGVLIFLIINNSIQGSDSILNSFVFKKFSEIKTIENASGSARLSTLGICAEILKSNPLAIFIGSGFTALTNAINASGVYATGAFIISFFTAAGIPVALLVFYPYIIEPIMKSRFSMFGIIYALIWLNTSLAQSRFIYPFLIFLPYIIEVIKLQETEE